MSARQHLAESKQQKGFEPLTAVKKPCQHLSAVCQHFENAMKLTAAQQNALDALEQFASGETPHGIATLQGYAGVGKTTVVAELLTKIGSAMSVLVTAPTHKALAVLGQKLDGAPCELMTTQAALGLKLTELDSGEHRLQEDGAACIADFDLAIVDEASMISAELFAAMLSSRRRCRILFVGDPAQLAPVGSEEQSPAFGPIVPLHVRLTEVVRQAEEHPSIRMSVLLRKNVANGEAPCLPELAAMLQDGDDRFICITSGGEAAIQQYALDALKHGLDTRILAFTNSATIRHNRAIHDALYPGVDGFAVGEKVIAQEGFKDATKRTWTQTAKTFDQVRTSELLTVKRMTHCLNPSYPQFDAWMVEMRRDQSEEVVCAWVARDRAAVEREISALFDTWRARKAEAEKAPPRERIELFKAAKLCSKEAWALRKTFANIRHAYALTIHKSQGSTFETVLIDWTSMSRGTPEDMARLAYVAITRPSKFAVIVTQ